MKTILLTGGAGFIGMGVAKCLLERGDNVLVLDNFNDYYDPSLKRARVDFLCQEFPHLKVFELDIIDYDKLDELFQSEKIDQVCHLAAQAGVRYSLDNPLAYLESNLRGTLHLLEMCRRHNVRDFIYASSSSVYGANEKTPFSESDRVDHPISLYAATKKSNEEMAYTYHHLFGLHCTGLRFFTVYGPWGRPDMALFKFVKNIFADQEIDVYNEGKMVRDFTYIEDIVSGVIAALDKGYSYEVFNLARGEAIELGDYIAAIEKAVGKSVKKNLMPMQPGDVRVTSGDISKAQKMLNYQPHTSVEEGVGNFVEWYRGYYKV